MANGWISSTRAMGSVQRWGISLGAHIHKYDRMFQQFIEGRSIASNYCMYTVHIQPNS